MPVSAIETCASIGVKQAENEDAEIPMHFSHKNLQSLLAQIATETICTGGIVLLT